jgi:hypothetical protein
MMLQGTRNFAGVMVLVVACLSAGVIGATPSDVAAAAPSSGTLYAWGDNISGELGIGENNGPQICQGSYPCEETPLQTELPSGVNAVSFAAGYEFAVAIGTDGKLYQWGEIPTAGVVTTPASLTLPSGVTPTALAAGSEDAYAIGSNGTLYAWGQNDDGQLGNGNETNSSTPVAVSLPSGVTAVAVAGGAYSAWAIGSDGRLYTWGETQTGIALTPTAITFPSGVSAIEVSSGAALGSDHQVYQLDGTTTPTVIALPTGVSATSIATINCDFIASGPCNSQGFAIGSDGNLYAWGPNDEGGNLGDGSFTASTTPVRVELPSGVVPVQVATTQDDGYAIGSDGNLYSWGWNDLMGLGHSLEGPQSCDGYGCSDVPVQVLLPSGQIPISLGEESEDAETGYVITVPATAPTLSGTPTSPAFVGQAYNYAFNVGGVPSPSVTLTSGALPPGLTLSAAGVLSGTPTTTGTYVATVTASNGVSPNATDTFTIVVVQPEVLGSGLQDGSVNHAFFGIYTQGTGSGATGYFTVWQTNWPNATSSKAHVRTASVTCVEDSGGTATITGTVTSGSSTETVVAQAVAGSNELRFSYEPYIYEVSSGCDAPDDGPVPIASGAMEIDDAPALQSNEILAFGNQDGTPTGIFGIDTEGTGASATGSFAAFQSGWPTAGSTATLETATVTCVAISGNTATISGTVTSGTSTEHLVAQVVAGSDEFVLSAKPNITKVSKGCYSPKQSPAGIASGDIQIGQ